MCEVFVELRKKLPAPAEADHFHPAEAAFSPGFPDKSTKALRIRSPYQGQGPQVPVFRVSAQFSQGFLGNFKELLVRLDAEDRGIF